LAFGRRKTEGMNNAMMRSRVVALPEFKSTGATRISRPFVD
jgi:hypothetical protein